MLVHKSQIGAIIGKGGVKIKELRHQTQSNIKIFPAYCPESTDRVVQITTDEENMPEVVQTLVDLLRNVSFKIIT